MKLARSALVMFICCCASLSSISAQTRLNNFVTVHIDEPSPAAAAHAFRFAEPGWVFIRVSGSETGTRVELDGIDEPVIAYAAGESGVRETMRFVEAGEHAVTVAGTVGRLEVRRVPEIRFCKFRYNPWVHHDGPYDWDFLTRHMLPHVNTVVGMRGEVQSAWAKPWRERGGRWIIETSAPGIDRLGLAEEQRHITADEVIEGLTTAAGIDQPWIDGQIIDEYFQSMSFLFEPTIEGARRVLADPRFAQKGIELYIAGNAEHLGDLFKGGAAAGCRFALERYNAVKPTRAEAEAHLRHELVDAMRGYAEVVPDAAKHMTVALGILSSPPESLDGHPHVDYRVFQDMEFHLLANDPVFDGLAGIMTYTSGYAEEETIRWVGRLYRHYCIEGRTDRLSAEPYILSHVENPDFTDGTNGWELNPAADGRIELRTIERSGQYAGRYKADGAGDTWLVMTRGAAAPNTARTRVVKLEPGRLYSLRMYSTNLIHRDGGYGNPTFDDISHLDIRIDGAEIDDARCFDHHYRSISTSGLMYFNYHVRRFRPAGDTVTLSISDWTAPDRRGGNVGRDTAINFVEVRRYLEDD